MTVLYYKTGSVDCEGTVVSLDIDMELTRPLIKDSLRNGVVKIEFEKANGEIREMHCTLNLDNLIAEEYHPSGNSTRKENPDVQVVFDLDKKEWRSFRWDRLLRATA